MTNLLMALYNIKEMKYGMAAFLNEHGIGVDEEESLSFNDKLDLMAEFAKWQANIISRQCEKAKRENLNE